MIDFIVKYWIQELFGLLIIIGTFLGKKAWKQYTKARQMIQDVKDREREQRIYSKLDEKFDGIESRFDDVVDRLDKLEEHDKMQDIEADKRKQGILALYKKDFLNQGKELLDQNHIITYEEYADYSAQHKLYNDLGGNHEGDEQFALVTTKYKTGLNNMQK